MPKTTLNVNGVDVTLSGTAAEVAKTVSLLTVTAAPEQKAAPADGAPKAPKGRRTIIVRSKTLSRLQKEAPRFDGMTVEQVAEAVVNGKRRLPKGWAIGEGWTHRVQTGHFPEDGCC